jgi:hypothetical protein
MDLFSSGVQRLRLCTEVITSMVSCLDTVIILVVLLSLKLTTRWHGLNRGYYILSFHDSKDPVLAQYDDLICTVQMGCVLEWPKNTSNRGPIALEKATPEVQTLNSHNFFSKEREEALLQMCSTLSSEAFLANYKTDIQDMTRFCSGPEIVDFVNFDRIRKACSGLENEILPIFSKLR